MARYSAVRNLLRQLLNGRGPHGRFGEVLRPYSMRTGPTAVDLLGATILGFGQTPLPANGKE